MRIFKIVKRIEALHIKEALRKEKDAEIVEVYHDTKENISSPIVGLNK